MNREELLATVGVTEYRPGDKIIEATDEEHVIAHLDIYLKRVVVVPPTPRGGNSATVAGETIIVAALANMVFDPDYADEKDWEVELLEAAKQQMSRHDLMRWLAVYGDPNVYGRHLFYFPSAAEPLFGVYDLADETWPPGNVDTFGGW